MFDQGRDIKFEVQFLLSLSLVVFGLMSRQLIREVTFDWIGYILIFVVSIYISIFILLYSIEDALSVKIKLLSSMDELSWPLLLLISTIFIYFIGHSIISLTLDSVIGYSFAPSLIFFKVVIPILPIAIMAPVYEEHVRGPVEVFSDINVKVIPNSLRVFDERDDRPFTVKVENLGSDTFDYDIQISIPDNVILHRNDEEIIGEFQETRSVGSNRADRLNFYVTHTLSERTNEEILVNLHSDGGHYEKSLQIQIEP